LKKEVNGGFGNGRKVNITKNKRVPQLPRARIPPHECERMGEDMMVCDFFLLSSCIWNNEFISHLISPTASASIQAIPTTLALT